jgi:hypothetical protein
VVTTQESGRTRSVPLDQAEQLDLTCGQASYTITANRLANEARGVAQLEGRSNVHTLRLRRSGRPSV